MYSLVLAMTMTGSAAPAPAWGNGCYGCNGCNGCYGAAGLPAHGCGGCYGYFTPNYGFAGCYGSCYGSYTNYFSYWNGPATVGYGYGYNHYVLPANYGPMPAWDRGGAYPGGAYPCAPAAGAVAPGTAGSGAVMPPPIIPAPVAPGAPAPVKEPEKKMPPAPVAPGEPPVKPVAPVAPSVDPKKPVEPKIGMLAAPARVVVELPADARLFANGQLTKQTTARREFVTPVLEVGQEFHYVLTVEAVRDGKLVRDTRTLPVSAGQVTSVNFGDLATAQVVEPASVAIR